MSHGILSEGVKVTRCYFR